MNKKSKVLFYDVETTPNLAYVWGKYEQDALAFESEWKILCFAYKWQGDKQVSFVRSTGKSDKGCIKKLHTLFDQADVVIAHNGDEFDQKKVRARFLYHNLTPPSQFASVDTLKVARRNFKLNSNKLDDLGKYLGLGRKVPHTGIDLWLGCMAEKPESWKLMEKYNRQDVVLLEKVYDKLRPWITNHPNISLIQGYKGCPNCGCKKVQKRGTSVTHTSLRQRWQCQECSSWFQTPYKRAA